MAERRKLLEDPPPRRRAVLEADAPAEGVTAPEQGELDLVDKVPAGLVVPATLDNVLAVADDTVKALIAEAAAKQKASGQVSRLAQEARRPRAVLNATDAMGFALGGMTRAPEPRVLNFVDLNPAARAGTTLPKVAPTDVVVGGRKTGHLAYNDPPGSEPARVDAYTADRAQAMGVQDLNPAQRGALQMTGRQPYATAASAAQEPYAVSATELRLGFTEWEPDAPPPCSGYWDVEVGGVYEGRLWFSTANLSWYGTRGGPVLAAHSAVSGSLAWRGLKAPWPVGYEYPVPGALAHNTRSATRRNY